ncbi:MAG: cytochrome c [Flavobacteriales bacterium]|jgi:mono/diheme cytochrome c family protein|nr:cytochrome c [Flavobacteriales bacterium]MBK6892812.1 cytochrome c [Flavobacteriales bacterium]MBK7246956.1 cytochrome c [Flavobacteriales bacterium]MBK7287329.1 cytochrome c [Flavobacteriales bacterium]MBK9061548.1 cytochrome c [Flavobacteriales bacterium]
MHTSFSLRRSFLPLSIALLVAACSSDTPKAAAPSDTPGAAAPVEEKAPEASSFPAGFITAQDITLDKDIDQGMVAEAKKIFDAKCHVCHGLTEEKVVGPGWKGVINERKPEWIMNMMLHTQWMVENDPDAQALVEETKTVMPDQELTKDQARAMLELIRSL